MTAVAPNRVFLTVMAAVVLVGTTAVSFVQAQVRLDEVRPAMGSPFRIVVCAPDSVTGRTALEAAWARIADLERTLSDYDPDSEVSWLAGLPAGRPAPLSDDLASAVASADSWWRRTGGAFDAGLGALTRLWRRAVRRNELPPESELAAARAASGWSLIDRSRDGRSLIRLHRGVRLDFGGIGKGIAADEALATLARSGLDRAIVDAGGDVTASGAPPDRPGWLIELPGGDFRYLAHGSVATSGATWRHVDTAESRYSHILDPETGRGLTGRRVVTVFAATGADADALATALSVVDPEQAVELAAREAWGARIEDGTALTVIGRLPDRAPRDARPSECRVTDS